MLGAISRASQALDLFTADAPEWGVSEVALELGIAKSSAHELLASLDGIGLVRRLPEGRYRLGWRILQLNRAFLQTTDMLGATRQRRQRLADALGVTVHVAGLRDQQVVYLEKIRGAHGPEISHTGTGTAMPAHSTASGKVLLAFGERGDVDEVVAAHGLARHTAATSTSTGSLQQELDLVRRYGYGKDLQETVPGLCCVAAPVRGAGGGVQATVSLTVPAARFAHSERQLRDAVNAAAGQLSSALRTKPVLAEVV